MSADICPECRWNVGDYRKPAGRFSESTVSRLREAGVDPETGHAAWCKTGATKATFAASLASLRKAADPKASGGFLTFEQWLAANPEAAANEQECEACDGNGGCTCLHCGDQHDCANCGGEGKIGTARASYEEQLKRDKRRWKENADGD